MKLTDNRLTDRQLFDASFLNLVPLICSLMVVLIHQHTVAGDIYTLPSRIISFFAHGICTAAVPTFFVISGYLFFRDAYTVADIFRKQKKRIKTVLMPFLAWSAFYYLLYAAVGVMVPGFLQSDVDLSLPGILKGIVFYEYAFPMWYMFQLCVYIMLAPALLIVLRNRTGSMIILIVFVVLGVLGCAEWQIEVGGYKRAIFQGNFFAYYWLGCLMTRWQNVQKILLNLARRLNWIFLVVALVVAGLLESVLYDGLLPSINNRCAVPLVFAGFFLLMVKLCHQMEQCPPPKVSTMVIYGVHGAIGVVLGRFVFAGVQLPAILHFLASFVAVTVTSVAVAWAMRYIRSIHWVFSGAR